MHIDAVVRGSKTFTRYESLPATGGPARKPPPHEIMATPYATLRCSTPTSATHIDPISGKKQLANSAKRKLRVAIRANEMVTNGAIRIIMAVMTHDVMVMCDTCPVHLLDKPPTTRRPAIPPKPISEIHCDAWLSEPPFDVT